MRNEPSPLLDRAQAARFALGLGSAPVDRSASTTVATPSSLSVESNPIKSELPTSRSDGDGDNDDDDGDGDDPDFSSTDAVAAYRPRSALARRLFPPTVPLPGTGDVVLVDAIGHPIGDILAKRESFGERWVVATDNPDVGALRDAKITYEYLPADFEGGLIARTHWFDYVYGIDSMVGIDEVQIGANPLTEPMANLDSVTTHEARPSQKTTGWRAVFSLAPVYRFAQKAIGADKVRQVLTDEFIRASATDRIVDLGCGTADILDYLPECNYVGVDSSQRYIDDARAHFGDRGTFVTSAAERFDGVAPDRTIALALGVLHHLDDEAASEMLQVASQTLEPGGRFVSFDPTLVEGQHPIAKLLVSRDRGQHVRTPEAQTELVRRWFPSADIVVRHDLLRPPYSHVIVSATASSS